MLTIKTASKGAAPLPFPSGPPSWADGEYYEDPHTAELRPLKRQAAQTDVDAVHPGGDRPAQAAAFDDEFTAPLGAKPAGKSPQLRSVGAAGALVVGTTLGSRYVLRQVIGQGGDAIVFRAEDLRHRNTDSDEPRPVAIKALRPERRASERALERLKREFAQMRSLEHPGIVRVFDLECDGEVWFTSMELVTGQTVTSWLQEPHELDERLRLIDACAEALAYAHSKSVLHGDLKASNVLVTADGGVKLIDFEAASGSHPSLAATVSYASPQVLTGCPLEVRDDVFSLSCLSYLILSRGNRPFGGSSSLEACRAGIAPAGIPGVPAHVLDAVIRGLAPERALRPESVRAFVEELRGSERVTAAMEVAEDCAVPAEPASREPEPALPESPASPVVSAVTVAAKPVVSPRSARRPPSLRFVAGLAAFLIGIAIVVWGISRNDPSPSLPPTPSPPPAAAPAVPNASPAAVAPASTLPVKESTPKPAASAERRATGAVTFESSSLHVAGAQSMVAIPLKRLHPVRDAGVIGWSISPGSALPGVDYQSTGRQLARFIEGQSARSLFIPLLKDGAHASSHGPLTFVVELRRVAGGAALGPITRVTVILHSR